ncbi:hypothetical protein KP509_37G013700 [Ceratopteris richardii]|uniref:Uncharacterized protein n=1 Tax=Ceratopteris richardii TaxID=49495 RepID=A0A8T2Q7R1_CERRI|nr:hypothetical protein KP509_37G013700 [Ceratopteris richardii]
MQRSWWKDISNQDMNSRLPPRDLRHQTTRLWRLVQYSQTKRQQHSCFTNLTVYRYVQIFLKFFPLIEFHCVTEKSIAFPGKERQRAGKEEGDIRSTHVERKIHSTYMRICAYTLSLCSSNPMPLMHGNRERCTHTCMCAHTHTCTHPQPIEVRWQ